ncbi:MAG: Na/Pi cotransporter family protein, partial [Firmicutes bacterium]|nr:Na/Pi cotransporter family protein [Bacillota bacterium]
CATALISSVGTSKNARRTSMVHLYFNIIGTITFLVGFYALNAIIGFSFIHDSVNAANIAIVHTIFNVVATTILFPFRNGLEKLACLTVKDDEEAEEFQMLDERLLVTPAIAVDRCKHVTYNMAKAALDAVEKSVSLIINGYDEKLADEVRALEDKTDIYEDKISSYVLKLNETNLSAEDGNELSAILHCIGDLERIGDHADNIRESAEEMRDKNVVFSEKGHRELVILTDAVKEIFAMAVKAYETNDLDLARRVEPLEDVIDTLKETIRAKHISRLKEGKCSYETGFVLSDIITNYERISDHCSNIALCVIEEGRKEYDPHEYINNLKKLHDKEYEELLAVYKEKYAI